MQLFLSFFMVSSEVEKLFRAFAEERKRALPQFTPNGIPITMENKFDDAIYNYLYEYWKTNSGEYDPKDDEIIMTKENSFTKNEKKFEQWLLQQYGMTNKEQREHTLKGNLESLWEIFSAADMVLFARGLPSIGKELAQLGKKAVDDVAEEAIEKTVKTEVSEEVVESTAKKEMADTAEDLSQKDIDKDDTLKSSEIGSKIITNYFSDDAIKHASQGEFTYNPKTGNISKMKGGGHGQENLDLLDSLGIKYNIEKTYPNGVRIGNVPSHKQKPKRTGVGQSWFPKHWDDKKIQAAGNYVIQVNKGVDIKDGVAIFAEYDGVKVGVIYTNGKPSTIFPNTIQP